MKDYDFSGWATKNDILCDDGRVIKRDAFKEQNGVTVPLVYNHDHKDIGNVLGHCVLENRDEGVYCYGYIDKDSPNAQHALSLIKNGSMKSLSIYANKLKEVGHNVIHGIIREVSLVLAGANKGAYIDTVLAHAADASDDEDGIIVYSGDENPIEHSGLDDEEFDKEAVLESMTEDQKKLMLIMMGMAAEDAAKSVSHSSKDDKDSEDPDNDEDPDDDDDEDEESELEHSKSSEDDEDEDKKKSCSHSFSLFHSSDKSDKDDEDDDKEDEEEDDEDEDLDDEPDDDADDEDVEDKDEDEDETNNKNNNKEKKDMTHNLFENQAQNDVLIHSAEMCSEMMADAVKFGSLKDSVMAHSADYGIDNIDYLFPNAKNYTTQPEFIKRRTEWVNEVLSGVRQ